MEMKPDKKAKEMTVAELAAYIDQSVLKPEFTESEIRRYIGEAVEFGCKTACINPSSLDIAREMTRGTKTGICVVCDFPFGKSATASKVMQAEFICRHGDVMELDIVANYGWIRSGMWTETAADIKAVTDICHQYGTQVKVILETDALDLEQVARGTECVIEAGADFVKTSTGFYTGGSGAGASLEIIRLMLDVAKGRCKVKGAGGIRDQKRFFELIDMGIDRMGIGYKSTPLVLGLQAENTGESAGGGY